MKMESPTKAKAAKATLKERRDLSLTLGMATFPDHELLPRMKRYVDLS